MENTLTWADFEKVDIRTGTIVNAQVFEQARKPAYQLEIDFGALGILKSSAQITEMYALDDLVGRQILAVVNFPPKQIANFMSECLVLGIHTDQGVVLLTTDKATPDGLKVS
jgi:tRNA-binding protein